MGGDVISYLANIKIPHFGCLLGISFVLIFNFGCLSNKPKNTARISPDISFSLCSPKDLGRSLTATFNVTIEHKGSTYQFPLVTEITDEKIVLVGLTPFGSRVFLLSYANEKLEYEAAEFFKFPLKPSYLVGVLQLIFWPKEAIEMNARKTAFRIVDTFRPNNKRVVLRNNAEIIRVQFSQSSRWGGNIVYEHLGPQLRISLSLSQLEILNTSSERLEEKTKNTHKK